MKTFLSCDWGMTSFRLRLVEIPGLQFTSVQDNDRGIAKTYESWKQMEAKDEERLSFYLRVLDHYIRQLEQQLNNSLQNVPVIISGMASSSIGMIELPYKEVPFRADGSDLVVKKIPRSTDFNHEMFIISGAKKDNDAMRGEETQLAGCEHELNDKDIFIFPGTHSKHVSVNNGSIIDIKTYMTGEFFELLSTKSILAASMEKGEGLGDKKNKSGFEAGVHAAGQSNLLHTSFTARTNYLFDKYSKSENYYYLSGLLIGTEVMELKKDFGGKITLVANDSLREYYATALTMLNIQEELLFHIQDADSALVKGQYKICGEKI